MMCTVCYAGLKLTCTSLTSDTLPMDAIHHQLWLNLIFSNKSKSQICLRLFMYLKKHANQLHQVRAE